MIDYDLINRNIAENPIERCATCNKELFKRWPFTGMPSRVSNACSCETEEPEDRKLREDWDHMARQQSYDDYDYED